jgi:hypothetical protein
VVVAVATMVEEVLLLDVLVSLWINWQKKKSCKFKRCVIVGNI